MKKENGIKKIVIPEERCRESSSYGLLSKEEKQLHYTKYAEGPRQKHSGMTLYNKRAFTLVELLVVVLIRRIGRRYSLGKTHHSE